MRVVIDTSVLVAASKSRRGASFAIVSSIPSPHFEPCLSVSLYAEWLEALSRPENLPQGVTHDDVVGFVRYLASQSHLQEIYFLWRPFLKDSDDDMLLELAVAANCRVIVTHNVRDFVGVEKFDIVALAPGQFLRLIRGNP
ncbi:MAG: putative toxin-antitoxin system toxin component, PIN family [Planctomycetota bacterium]